MTGREREREIFKRRQMELITEVEIVSKYLIGHLGR